MKVDDRFPPLMKVTQRFASLEAARALRPLLHPLQPPAPPLRHRLADPADVHHGHHHRRAWRQGRREPRAAFAADALAEMLSSPAAASPSRAELVVVVDLDALLRSYIQEGERCHVPGVGPLPVAVARRIASDAFLKGVLVHGCEIRKVKHFGRHIPAEVRTALQLGPALDLDWVTCVEEGCGRRHGLECDHDEPLAHHGPTAYNNLKARCRPHHRDKTQRDRQAGLLGRGP